MLNYRPILFILFVFLAGCPACSFSTVGSTSVKTQKQESIKMESEEYRVYSALLEEVYVRDGADPLVIVGETSLDALSRDQLNEDLGRVGKDNRGVATPDVVGDFVTKNLESHALRCNFKLSARCLVMSKEEVSAVGETKDGWTVFLSKYPGQSIITLSRAGFNPGMDKALVYTSSQSGGRTGKGQYVFLIKVGNAWAIEHKVLAWVS